MYGERFQVTRLLKRSRGIETLIGVDRSTGDEVVIKATAKGEIPGSVRIRLEHEAGIPGQVENDALVSVLAHGSDDDQLYFAMPFVPGTTLEQRVSESRAIRRRKLGRFVALDSDVHSLEEIHRCYGDFGVEIMAASIRRLLNGSLQPGEFNFIDSMGLFDYLRLPTGQRLVSRLFEMLRPGGRLVVANFLPEIRDVGYMEAFMDRDLIYRTRAEMMELTMNIPQADLGDVRVFSDEESTNILFLEISKPRASRR